MSIWHGQHMFLWQKDKIGSVNAVVNKAKKLGIDGVLVKCHEGGTSKYWNQFEELLEPLKKTGIIVGAWGYVYGNNPEEEADLAIKALDAGADWYIIDAEKEYKGKHTEAERLASRIRNKKPSCTLAFTSFDICKYHSDFPYKEFADYCDVWMPQVYWGYYDGGLKRWDLARESYEATIPNIDLMPVGQTYDVTAKEMSTFVKITKPYNKGIAWWDWQHANTNALQAIKEIQNQSFDGGDDVKDHWAEDSIRKMKEKGFMSGYEDGSFKPDKGLTRAEFCKVMDRILTELDVF